MKMADFCLISAVSPTILVGEQVVGGYQVKTNVENAYKQEILL